jgi:hypothetical protein
MVPHGTDTKQTIRECFVQSESSTSLRSETFTSIRQAAECGSQLPPGHLNPLWRPATQATTNLERNTIRLDRSKTLLMAGVLQRAVRYYGAKGGQS